MRERRRAGRVGPIRRLPQQVRLGVHHEDGTPPYDVRWSDTHDVTLVFPGPDAHIQHLGHRPESGHPEAEASASDVLSRRWLDPGDIGSGRATGRP
ncbi:DNA-binding protein [Streptomyces sp. NBRC 110611]|uniref:DUF1918 domain-containing protein n=1 Tax=Streptomyces sp. NBRC 110611 TaxID=1621259 RepID=UPI000856E44F|nr:DNA-binding protein [Streptomyces sp. NBRC 110611]